PLVPQVLVDGGDKGGLGRLLRRAAVLQPGGVVVVLDDVHLIGKAAGHAELHLVLRLVRPVPALLLRLPEHRRRQAPLSRKLRHIVHDAVFVEELRLFEPTRLCLVPEPEGDPGVHHRLALHHVGEVLRRDGDVREHVQVGKPAGAGAGFS
ncbi:transcription antitermination factor NusB, partial [Dysosmobacter welbionis]